MFLQNAHKNSIELDRSEGSHRQRKWKCPSCGKKRFVRYFNFASYEYLPEEYGRCDREESCGYFQKPESRIIRDDKIINFPSKSIIVARGKSKEQPKPIEKEYLSQTLKHYKKNNFYQFLEKTLGPEDSLESVKRYFIGTSKGYQTVFWYIDKHKQIRTGKVMLYQVDGRRNRQVNYTWVHSLLKRDKPETPLFGEHLLYDLPRTTPIGVVESEKTAVVASYFFRDTVWLASGGADQLNAEKLKSLKGHPIMLFPDFADKARKKWQKISNEAYQMYGLDSRVSSLNEEINDGSDIADYLLEEIQNCQLKESSFFEITMADYLSMLTPYHERTQEEPRILEPLTEAPF